MRKVILNMNMTFDGFFNLDWMGPRPFTPDQELIDDNMARMRGSGEAATSGSGGAFVGYSFYRGMAPYWRNMEDSPESTESQRAMARAVNASHRIVISRTEEKLEGENAELLVVKSDQDLVTTITRLKEQAGSDFALIGGVRTAQTFARLGLIDEYEVLVHPVAVGKGERVWTSRNDLSLVSVKAYPSGVMRVRYRPA
ncbi:riboflavin biosynthesis protein RibD [Reticulibacter mediterranei]|uniref:Riboflavin biosynthesis protein RibD n=1 Tax=Reticulibacter mediterranei TaxID=2778369 RepID=A0A8J3IN54_9CHLR|nr:dihydrofolate reductase family protein [Reticulibacter mediterranei]GHO93750.1 riboflavin biosynthesis protein RibD [Reticulibacter mediterranei]